MNAQVVTTEGVHIMDIMDDVLPVRLDMILTPDNIAYQVVQRNFIYERNGLTVINPKDTEKNIQQCTCKVQVVVQEVSMHADA